MSMGAQNSAYPTEYPLNRKLNHLQLHHAWYAYGNGYVLRQYMREKWPLIPFPLGICHSYSSDGATLLQDFKGNKMNHFWVFSEIDYEKIVNKQTPKQSLYICGHPAIYTEWKPGEYTEGSLALPDHSSHAEIINFEDYLVDIGKLPDKFHPITIGLNRNMSQFADICKKRGFRYVYSGEHKGSFYPDLLNLWSKWKYVHTTYGGSTLWLAVLAGCRVFYRGTIEKRWLHNGAAFTNKKYYESIFDESSVDDNHVAKIKQELLGIHFGLYHKKEPAELQSILTSCIDENYRSLIEHKLTT